MPKPKHYDHFFKVALLGNSGAGKTALSLRYMQDKFNSERHVPSIGVEFATKRMEIQNKTVQIQLWDCAGSTTYKSIIPTMLNGARAIILVIDLKTLRDNDINTIVENHAWCTSAILEKAPNSPMFLCITKEDLEADGESGALETKAGELADKIRQQGLKIPDDPYFTSAKNGNTGIDKLFEQIGQTLLEEIQREQEQQSAETEAADVRLLANTAEDSDDEAPRGCCSFLRGYR